MIGIPDVIICANFGEDQLRGLGVAVGQSLPFSLDFDRRPYNTLALPCACVIEKLHTKKKASFRLASLPTLYSRVGAVAQYLRHWTSDQSSRVQSPAVPPSRSELRQVVHTHVPLFTNKMVSAKPVTLRSWEGNRWQKVMAA